MSFSGKKFRSRREQIAYEASLAGKYQARLKKNPFLYFGLPFCSIIVLGSYWLSGFTAVRYEQKDRKIQEVNEDDLIKLKGNKRKFDLKEEYYRLQGLGEQDWEPVRVPRMKGESENVW
ncbi:LAME_0C02894g1_1 [Lachancea meyersii CBS 8951]|uniref:Cytochrome c oxidase assembly protein COX16, mitochondrial n=1 Tax=Lachancea meyersii CBS 8951 TaxID=1266667 RepID=A0A1G4IZZ3_9SACH|nr:LAME_0C02894g1_1 [Lachancea meyersii CBS 8951]